jgi:hypothetical protein
MAKRKNEKYIVSELKGFPETRAESPAAYSE